MFWQISNTRGLEAAELGNSILDTFEVGYYKGRGSAKVWIKSVEDLKCMYDAHGTDYDHEIGLWCQE